MVRRLKTPEAIFRFVSQEVRYMGLTMEDKSPGYAPHDVSITFDNRYGVCRDKAALLVAMLRIGGYNAFPILINVGAKLDEEIPLPFFNHAIVAIEKGGEYSLMDPTNENTKDMFPSYLCNLSYLVARPEGDVLRVSPMPDPKKNSVVAVSSATLDSDGGMAYRTKASFGGINDTAYRGALAKMTPEARRKFFERRIKGISPSAELVECVVEPADVRDTSLPLKVEIVAKLPEMTLKGESRVELSVPFATRVLGLVGMMVRDNTALEKRKYPLVLDTTVGVGETLEIDLGGTLGEALSLPGDEDMKGVFSYSCAFRMEGGVLRATRSMSLNSVELSPEEYLELRESLKRREIAERRRCVFAVNKVEDRVRKGRHDWRLRLLDGDQRLRQGGAYLQGAQVVLRNQDTVQPRDARGRGSRGERLKQERPGLPRLRARDQPDGRHVGGGGAALSRRQASRGEPPRRRGR